MWLWQPRKLLKLRLVFWSRIFLVSTLMHTTLLFLLLCVYKGDNFSFHFSVDRQALHEANIVFLPLQKHAVQPVRTQKTAAHDGVKQPKAARLHKKSHSVVQDLKPGTRIVAPAKPKPKKRLVKKSELKKESPKLQEVVEKKVETKAEPAQEAKTATQEKAKVADDALYLGRADLDALQIQDAISHEILTHWRPPAGLAKTVSCELKILLAWDGKISSVAVQKGSGVVIFDMSARKAAHKMQLPKWAWGKELIITFNQ